MRGSFFFMASLLGSGAVPRSRTVNVFRGSEQGLFRVVEREEHAVAAGFLVRREAVPEQTDRPYSAAHLPIEMQHGIARPAVLALQEPVVLRIDARSPVRLRESRHAGTEDEKASGAEPAVPGPADERGMHQKIGSAGGRGCRNGERDHVDVGARSEEHTSEL